MKKAVLFILCILGLQISYAQNPLEASIGFNLLVRQNFTINSGDIEGSIGVGGNFQIEGGGQNVGGSSGGDSYVFVGSSKYRMIVGGSVSRTSGMFQTNINTPNNAPLIKIGTTNTLTFIQDGSNVKVQTGGNTLIWQINNTSQAANSLGGKNIFSFSGAFSDLISSSLLYAGCGNTVNPGFDPGSANPKITLASGSNIWNVSLSHLNSIQTITFQNAPSADKPLIINVSGNGSFNVPNLSGIGRNEAKYILWNFFEATTLSISGATLEGSLLAPQADINKTNSSNIEGQVIANSFIHSGGEIHIATFEGNLSPCCAPVTNVTFLGSGCVDTFSYQVCQQSNAKDLSHFTIGLPNCITSADIKKVLVNGSNYAGWSINTDPTCGIYGLKWDTGVSKGTCKTFTYITNSKLSTGPIEFAAKSGTCCQTGESTGPTCNPCQASLGNYSWYDINNNGLQDIGETPAANVTISLYTSGGSLVGTKSTDTNGYYLFDNLTPGDYYIKASHPNSKMQLAKSNIASPGDASDSDIDKNTLKSATTTLSAGENDLTWDVGWYFEPTGEIGDPCICRNDATNAYNGRFDEIVFVDATPGYGWKIIAQTGMFLLSSPANPASPIPVPLGTYLVEQPAVNGEAHYDYEFLHIDSLGYSVTLQQDFTGKTLSIANYCYYPEIPISGDLVDTICYGNYDFNLPQGNLSGTSGGTVYYSFVRGPGDTLRDITSINPTTAGLTSGQTYTIILKYVPNDPAKCQNTQILTGGLFIRNCSISGYVKVDTDNNGIGDTPLEGVKITLLTENLDYVAEKFTDINGYYEFNFLPPGNYILVQTQPNGYDSIMDEDEDPDGDPMDGDVMVNDTVFVRLLIGEADIENNFVEQAQVVPIDLRGFGATPGIKGVSVKWQSGEEKNFSHFELYNSANGKVFKKIAEIPSKGSGSIYQFFDASPYQGENYYYLNMVDLDLKQKQSKYAIANFKGNRQISFYPNPVQDVLYVQGTDDNSFIKIMDLTGKLLQKTSTGANNSTTIELGKLQSGIYIMEYKFGGELYYEKIMVTSY